MTVFELALALGAILAAGWGLARLLAGNGHGWHGWELAGVSWVFGTGYISLAIWIFGFAFSSGVLVAITAVGAGLLALIGWRIRAPRLPREPWTKVNSLLLTLLVAEAVFIGWWALQLALGWDGLMIWELKARIAFESGGALPSSYFADPDRSWSHPTYPLYFPYNEAWLYLCLGRVDQAWVRLFGPLAYVATAALLIGGLRRLGSSQPIGLAAAAGIFFVPYCFGGGWGVLAGYADFPLAVIFLCALIYWPLLREVSAGEARLFGIAVALLIWAKSEGSYLWLILAAPAALILAWRQRWAPALWAIFPGALLLGGFRVFLGAMRAVPEINYAPVSWPTLHANAARIGPILERFGHELIDLEKWSLLWPGVAAALLALWLRGRSRQAFALGAALLLPMTAYGCAYLLSTWSDFLLHIELSLTRLLLQLAPAAVLTIALAVPAPATPAATGSSE